MAARLGHQGTPESVDNGVPLKCQARPRPKGRCQDGRCNCAPVREASVRVRTLNRVEPKGEPTEGRWGSAPGGRTSQGLFVGTSVVAVQHRENRL